MEKPPFSVLLSVYKKDNPNYFQIALESIFQQSVLPNEIVLVEDGPLTTELYNIIESFQKQYSIIHYVKLPTNQQLGRALAVGLKNCSYDLVARMDSDDIAVSTRFEKQIDFMMRNPEISVCGGEIAEFIIEGEILRVKHMPIAPEKIYHYGKFRNPLNHMTVMFRKSDILQVGNYKHLIGLEDYYLWSRVLAKGKKLGNIPEVLVYARIGQDFAGRRGGLKYFQRYVVLRRLQRKIGYTNIIYMVLGIILSAGMTLQPKWIREKIYRLLR